MDFEGMMGDEMTVQVGDVVTSVTKPSEEGWLEGELRGKRGIFPANFVKEVPVYLIGGSQREPRSLRKCMCHSPMALNLHYHNALLIVCPITWICSLNCIQICFPVCQTQTLFCTEMCKCFGSCSSRYTHTLSARQAQTSN
ncbi:unnamed protein product [Oncorhynchus mykiss]|uniref:SH3 domain-containing protein n=1 Tax=Oncorhynchus mykiss TaxID=8022 RepID=A0A061A523_ONCMY|nr:unnamed protein product [Oncorhynchus mykiss]